MLLFFKYLGGGGGCNVVVLVKYLGGWGGCNEEVRARVPGLQGGRSRGPPHLLLHRPSLMAGDSHHPPKNYSPPGFYYTNR